MLRDVFYYGKKPNVHPREQHAKNLADAKKKSTTPDFWIINEFCDYTDFEWDFDFEFLPDTEVWAQEHNNAWPSKYQKDSGTWLCSKTSTDLIIYRNDVEPVKRKNEKHDSWVLIDEIDERKFDFGWHPDPTSPPYIYKWGCNFYPPEIKSVLEYNVPGATEVKYMRETVPLLPKKDNWRIYTAIDYETFDFSWRPDPREPPYIYVWGNKYISAELQPTVEYHCPEATEKKYMPQHVGVTPEWDKWKFVQEVDKSSFDFTWRPDPREPAYIYTWGNKYIDAELMPTLEYHCTGAKERKYMTNDVGVLPQWDNWHILYDIDKSTFDFSWRPDPREPALIYVWGNDQHVGNIMPTVEYRMEGATERKYMDTCRPKLLPDKSRFMHLEDSHGIDYSFYPDPTSPPYIYAWGNQWNKPEDKISIQLVVPGATEYKYMQQRAIRKPCKDNWIIPSNVDVTGFDFSWEPSPADPPYIYEFGTQWQKTGGPRYMVKGAKEVKYVTTQKVKALPNKENWLLPTNLDLSEFDFSWHPDSTEAPYIYYFPTQWALTGGPLYVMPGATEKKYMDEPVAKATVNMQHWEIPSNIDKDSFDFSWHPVEEDRPYIYQFGTQWQKTGGPRYHTPGSDEMSPVKYIDRRILKAKANPVIERFTILDNNKIKDFDFSWHPDNTETPYIYRFGNDKYSAEIMPTIEYRVEGATQVKYVKDLVAKLDVNYDNWTIPKNVDKDNFDFAWVPHPNSPPYIYEFATIYNDRGGPIYTVPGATEKKYISDVKAKLLPNKKNWNVKLPINENEFDFAWVPHPKDPPYIYVFGNQWNKAEKEPTVEYVVPGATDYKYVTDIVAKVLPQKSKFKVLLPIIEDEFDFSWRPDPYDDPYIYVFGNTQYPGEIMPTVKYTVKGATQKKYVNNIKAKLAANSKNWKEVLPIDKTKFDFSWVPNPKDPAYIYVFGNQWNSAELEPTIEYHVKGATEIKYVKDIVAKVLPTDKRWKTLIPVKSNFDYSWRPNPTDPPYIYVFGNQWHIAEKEPTIEYIVPGATDRKYVKDIVAEVVAVMSNWEIPKGIDTKTFDFSWRPDPGSPPYIYQFGTLTDDNDGPKYITPNNNGEVVRLLRVNKKTNDELIGKYYIETNLEDLIQQHPDELFWALRKEIDYTNFDFNWRPNIEQARYVHVFGSSESQLTQTYFVSAPMYLQGHKDYNFVEQGKKVDSEYLATLFKPSDMFFVDRGNKEVSERFEKLKAKFPNIQKTRFLNSWTDTITRCINRSNTTLCWILNSELDYSEFDFNYYPNEWQMKMIHVFGTQWSHWGTTYMVNRDTFAEDTKYVKVIEHLKNLNFVKDRKAKATNNLYDIIVIDFGNKEADRVVKLLTDVACGKNITKVNYETDYLTTIRKIVNDLSAKKEYFVWICSSVCNYSTFDFTYICDPFAKDNLHVFPSDQQKFGDTFLLDVNKAKEIIDSIDLLQQYSKVNYNSAMRVKRLNPPVIKTGGDSHVNSIKSEFDFPYAIFQTEELKVVDNEPINLWSEDTQDIIITSTGATRIIVPKVAQKHIDKELYDYPRIKKASRLVESNPLDIVFLSNGEKNADENYEHLLAVTKGLPNKVVRVDGVNGRVDAYHASAKASTTPWTFTVFAKLKVNSKFDWGWQPDRLQIPKHYIFHAKNPVNGLVYGHQAMIAYNKQLVFNNWGDGLDFTLDDPHETVELLSGTANFNTDPYSTWRTAFREVIKLKSDYSEIASERLKIWTTKAKGKFANECLQGATDALEYYNQVHGDMDKLKLSYEWSWLKDYYIKKYK